ncbi:DUF5067 domain-containing protein [Nosocomiicoccus sp. HMSC059G07]|uniref:DUF5067 domain-containing protein n=1 Tax=Nosocomiicoccus sp. HMSC059G07 TaxID=1739531 RepID=UPI0008A356C4|nr:DUF5067 domain-containing protein [Nosocomiicoccus sp. HMSC059G07]OFO55813.1 hypothetical protein HMPREF3029_03075 [Nosocomiicoccus sp. HMSC059G07]
MKKVYFTIALPVLFLLTGCSNEPVEHSQNSDVSEMRSSVAREEVTDGKQYLENKTAYLRDVNVTILESEVIPMGTYEYQENAQLVITYEVKNKTNEDINPLYGYMIAFDAFQEEENALKRLDVGPTPYMNKYDWALETQLDIIKKDGSLKNIIAYDLRDTETPVTLIASDDVSGDYLGEIIIHVK